MTEATDTTGLASMAQIRACLSAADSGQHTLSGVAGWLESAARLLRAEESRRAVARLPPESLIVGMGELRASAPSLLSALRDWLPIMSAWAGSLPPGGYREEAERRLAATREAILAAEGR